MLRRAWTGLAIALWVGGCLHAPAAALADERLAARYEELLILERSDYRASRAAPAVFEGILLERFEDAVVGAQAYPYEWRGVPAYYTADSPRSSVAAAETAGAREANDRFLELLSSTLPMLAYAYRTPGPERGDNPYYRHRTVAQLFAFVLEYAYSRGLTETAWTPDHAGTASRRAERAGLVRASGDFSGVSQRLGGLVQSIFLMREPLAERGLLEKYRRVVRNLTVNNGTMYGAFFLHAREEAGIDYPQPLPEDRHYYLNADGVRLFADYFIPYFLLIENVQERRDMEAILRNVIAANMAICPGVQGTIKPDGTGFHHGTAYVGAYAPFTFESFARLLYLFAGTDLYDTQNVDAVRLALESFRTMVQKYTVSSALRGRLLVGNNDTDGDDAATAVIRAMALMAHPDGLGDPPMRARFNEFFDPDYFFASQRLSGFHQGQRGMQISGLGIYRLVADVLAPDAAAETPSGVSIKPYAAAAFFRRGDWLVTAKGFSRYFWDYEGPLEKRQNGFGQNWSYGLLQVFSAGDPVSAAGSGHDLGNGWDWYHVPGTTASHYPIAQRSYAGVVEARRRAGIRRDDPQRNYNSKTYVGGVTLGEHGFFVQDLEAVPFTAPTDLSARKSYFFVGDRVLALGTHIRGGTANDATHTTLFQTRVRNGTQHGSIDGVHGDSDGNVDTRVAAGSQATLTDSAGNSYFLHHSTADLHFRRGRQRSLTPGYEPTASRYVRAYIDHGIRPEGDSYQYVVIPADPGGQKAAALAQEPSAYFRVIDDDRMHLVHFPEWGITAHAFYETVETMPDTLVRSVNLPAAVITRHMEEEVHLAASVPDLGWESDDAELYRGLSYGSREYATQTAATHRLQVVLRGRWEVVRADPDVGLRIEAGETLLEIPSRDGLSRQLVLRPTG